MHEAKKKEYLYAATFLIGLIIFLVYLFLFGHSLGKAVEVFLVGIGWLIMLLGFFLLFVSRVTRERSFTILENQEIEAKEKRVSYNYVFPIVYPSTINGKITVETTKGPFSLSIFEYFGQFLWTGNSEWFQKAYVSYRFLSGAGVVNFGPTNLKPGNYYVCLKTKSGGFKAIVNIAGVYHVRPHAWIYDLACTLLEIGIPIMVTGLILLVGK